MSATCGDGARVVTAVLHLTTRAHRKLSDRVQAGQGDFTLTALDGSMTIRTRVELEQPSPGEECVAAGVFVDWIAHTVRTIDGQVTVSRTELRILHVLLAQGGAVMTARDLSRRVWRDEDCDGGRSRPVISPYIASLRKRLRSIGLGAALQTVRRSGYRLVV